MSYRAMPESGIRVWIIGAMAVVALLFAFGNAGAEEISDAPRTYEEFVAKSRKSAFVTHRSVSSPFGGFILIRKGLKICAVRFTEYHRGYDARASTVFRSGEESQYGQYDWFYQKDGSMDLTKNNVTSGHRKLHRKPLVGIGRLAFQTGQVSVKCGPFEFDWQVPWSITFNDGSTDGKDFEVEFSPTKWSKIKDINLKNERLNWYRYDGSRKEIYLSLDELP